MLIAFGGLPGTGKTTLARLVAARLRASHIRIDDIEQALRESGMLQGDVGPAGYMAAYAVAETNLRLGRVVVADCVNPLAITRTAWRGVAAAASSAIVEIEIICSDPAEHRQRVETRASDIAGLVLPGWDAVRQRNYEPWDRPHIVLDTAGLAIADAAEELLARIGRAAPPSPGP